MKKILAVVIILGVLAGVGSCGLGGSSSDEDTKDTSEETTSGTSAAYDDLMDDTTPVSELEKVEPTPEETQTESTTEPEETETTTEEPVSDTTSETEISDNKEQTTQQTTTSNTSSGEATVYISETGSKYHSRQNCGRMNGGTAVKESEAIAAGYGKCQKCW